MELTNEQTNLMLLSFAARVDQILHELETAASSKRTPFFAGHEMMLAHSLLRSGSRYLTNTAKRYKSST